MSWALTFDCHDARRAAAFWRIALGYADAAPPRGFASWEEWFDRFDVPVDERGDAAALVDPDGVLPGISFLRVPEAKTVKNRVHVDVKVSGGRDQPAGVRTARIEAHVALLVEAGGRVLGRHENRGALDHVVMADPEGNELCVV